MDKNPEQPGRPAEPLPGSPAALVAAIEALLPFVDDAMESAASNLCRLRCQLRVKEARQQIEAARGTITSNADAYVFTDISIGKDTIDRLARGDAAALTFLHYRPLGQKADVPLLKVATATITLRLLDRKDMVDAHVQALRAEQARIRALAEVQATELERQVQSMLAIELK